VRSIFLFPFRKLYFPLSVKSILSLKPFFVPSLPRASIRTGQYHARSSPSPSARTPALSSDRSSLPFIFLPSPCAPHSLMALGRPYTFCRGASVSPVVGVQAFSLRSMTLAFFHEGQDVKGSLSPSLLATYVSKKVSSSKSGPFPRYLSLIVATPPPPRNREQRPVPRAAVQVYQAASRQLPSRYLQTSLPRPRPFLQGNMFALLLFFVERLFPLPL